MFQQNFLERACRVILIIVLMVVAMAGLQPAGTAYAATITVSTVVDEDMGNGGTGCSLREAIIAANTDAAYNGCPKGSGKDTITFDPYLVNIVLRRDLPDVTSNITFIGSTATGWTTVDGNGPSGPWRSGFVIVGANVTISHMRFQNGFADEGGAIYKVGSGALSIDMCVFQGNAARTNGGAIYLSNSPSLTITSSSLTDNQAMLNGGAIYAANGLPGINLKEVDISGNTAVDGGAIAIDGPLTGIVNMSDVQADSNQASGRGGVLFNENPSSSFTLNIDNGSEFISNYAAAGAAIFTRGGLIAQLNVSYSHFRRNESENEGGVFSLDSVAALRINKSVFNNNVAGGVGGVLSVNVLTDSLVAMSSNFVDNEATDGGAFFVGTASSAQTVQLTDNRFSGNHAQFGGGGMWINGLAGNLEIRDGEYDTNTAIWGGVLYLPNANLTDMAITNSIFWLNSSYGDGGSIALGEPGERTAMVAAVAISGSTFLTNSSLRFGGAIYLKKAGNLSISETTFDANHTREDGGAILIGEMTGPVTISDTTFGKNMAEIGHGGAIALNEGSLNQFSIANTTFHHNISGSGGAIFTNNSVLNISQSVFTDNRANVGGALWTNGSESLLSVTDTTFTRNFATLAGSALLADGTFITMEGNLFWRNGPSASGGVITFPEGVLHSNCFEQNSGIAVWDVVGGNDVTQNWWNDPGGPNQGTADKYFSMGAFNHVPWLTTRPACPQPPAP